MASHRHVSFASEFEEASSPSEGTSCSDPSRDTNFASPIAHAAHLAVATSSPSREIAIPDLLPSQSFVCPPDSQPILCPLPRSAHNPYFMAQNDQAEATAAASATSATRDTARSVQIPQAFAGLVAQLPLPVDRPALSDMPHSPSLNAQTEQPSAAFTMEDFSSPPPQPSSQTPDDSVTMPPFLHYMSSHAPGGQSSVPDYDEIITNPVYPSSLPPASTARLTMQQHITPHSAFGQMTISYDESLTTPALSLAPGPASQRSHTQMQAPPGFGHGGGYPRAASSSTSGFGNYGTRPATRSTNPRDLPTWRLSRQSESSSALDSAATRSTPFQSFQPSTASHSSNASNPLDNVPNSTPTSQPSSENRTLTTTSNSSTPTPFDLVNSQHGVDQLEVNKMLASTYAETYAHSVHDWCLHLSRIADSTPVPSVHDTIRLMGIDQYKIGNLRKKFVCPTVSHDRKSIHAGQGVLKCYLQVLFARTNLVAAVSNVPGLVTLCKHLANNPDSLAPHEWNDWDVIIKIHTGEGIREISEKYEER